MLQILGVLDHLFAFGKLHISFLPVAAVAFVLSAAAHLAVKIGGAHVRDFHAENLLHRFLDLRLGVFGGNFKNHGVLRLFYAQPFFRDDRAANDLVVRRRHRLFLALFLGGLCRFLGSRFGFLGGRRFRGSFLFPLRRRRDGFHVGNCRRRFFRIERMA